MRLRLVSPILMWLIVALGAVPALVFLPGRLLFHRHLVFLIILVMAGAYWLTFMLGAGQANRQVARSAAGIDHIVTTGVYGLVRHPIYAADIVLAWAIFLYYPALKLLAVVIWLTVILTSWMKLEERALQQKFGQEYVSYKASTPMIIPNILSKVGILKR